MIEILEQSTGDCLAVRFSGKVTGQEYQQFLDALGFRLKNNEKVSLVCGLQAVDFYGDFEAAKKDFKFGFGDYRRIYRAAYVGEQKWLAWFVRFLSPFTKTEEKHFPQAQFKAAFNWVCAES